jgi:hypothetical protein
VGVLLDEELRPIAKPGADIIGIGRDVGTFFNGHRLDRNVTSIMHYFPTPRPPALWPPPRMATSSSYSRPKFTDAMTSAMSTQRAIRRGRRSIIVL